MSDVSVLSHEYKTASELSRSINDAVIELKKARNEGSEACWRETAEDRRRMSDILLALASLLSPLGEGDSTGNEEVARVSGALVSRIRSDKGGALPYYIDDLRSVAKRLRDECGEPTQADMSLLDELAAASSAETSRVYRRLMRR